MDAKWSPDRVRLELYALIDRRLVAIEASIAGLTPIAASNVTVSPNVDLLSTNVQSALEELQNEILLISGGTTNLSFTGVSSVITLNSSTGTDVTFTAGTGISLSASGSNITISNTGSGSISGTGDATEVAFWSSTGVLSGEPLLQWDTTNKRLGVNIIAPEQTLDVRGVARITGSEGTATNLMGRDIDGDVSAITVGSNLSLVGNVLSATGGSSGSSYSQVLGAVTTEIISPATHGLSEIRTILVLDPSGNSVAVNASIVANTVTLNSNVSLLGCTVYLTGEIVISYTEILGSGLTATIVPATHNLLEIHSVLVLDPSGNQVSTQVSIVALTVTISSNINLLNHTLILA